MWNYLITQGKDDIIILKIKQHVWHSHLVIEIFVWGYVLLVLLLLFTVISTSYEKRPRENALLPFDNNDSKAGLHLNIKGNMNFN